jgi:hypothetical protein
MKTFIIPTTTAEGSSGGLLQIKEWGQSIDFSFTQEKDFRGTLIAVEWNGPDNVKHRLTAEDEAFALFSQVGERPEIRVPSSWFASLGLSGTFVMRLKFEFQTFRQEPSWYAHLYFKDAYGDQNAPYKVSQS